MNLIENLWREVKIRVMISGPSTLKDLERIIKKKKKSGNLQKKLPNNYGKNI